VGDGPAPSPPDGCFQGLQLRSERRELPRQVHGLLGQLGVTVSRQLAYPSIYVFLHEVGVGRDRGLNVRMPEGLACELQVPRRPQEARRERVPQRVRRHAALDARAISQSAHELANVLRADRLARLEGLAFVRPVAAGPAVADRAEDVPFAEGHLGSRVEPRTELGRRARGERYPPWLAALAPADVHVRVLAAFGDQVCRLQGDGLRDAQARVGHDEQKGEVALATGVAGVHGVEQRVELLFGEGVLGTTGVTAGSMVARHGGPPA